MKNRPISIFYVHRTAQENTDIICAVSGFRTRDPKTSRNWDRTASAKC